MDGSMYLRRNSNELEVTNIITTKDNVSLCSDFDREPSDLSNENVDDPGKIKSKFIAIVKKVMAVPKIPESRSSAESPYKIPAEDMVYIRKLTRITRFR